MAVMDLVNSLGNSVLGRVEKAMLYIHDTSGAEGVQSQDLVSTTMEVLAGAASAIPTSTNRLSIRSHEMTVQYNPESLSIQANAEAIPFTYLQQNVDSGIPNQNLRPPMVVLSVQLVFDDMNTQDAFMLDKLRLSVGAAISDVAGAEKLAKGGYTVQPQTNGLIATVMRPNTKVVTFVWADMAFTGQVTEVQAKYTMFSPSGRPVRSVVQLNIAQQVESESDSAYWDQVLDKTFQQGSVLSGKSMDQQIGNILNLNMF